MFKNVGGKIKGLAVFIAVAGIIGSIAAGISIISNGSRYNDTTLLGIGVMFGGSLFSWLSSLFMYGFGELIEKTTEISINTNNANLWLKYGVEKLIKKADINANNDAE
ncbi:MAG: hypothetical protein FWE80_04220 [Oscillospiraceae bacterium]|nr:hypothetical protein [Oscillospiraceae bacterium]